MNYTKGPWKLDTGDASASIIDSNGDLVIAGEYDGYMTPFECRDTEDECLSNAHLISAAPDLYEALKGMAELLREHAPPMWRTLQEYTDALAALSKAEGK